MTLKRAPFSIAATAIVLVSLAASPTMAFQDTPEREACTARNTHAHSRCGFLATYDIDGDGVISRAEFDQIRAEGYDLRDADGDGVVAPEEYVAEYEVRLDQQLAERREAAIRQTYVRFDALDTDDDEVMTEAEFNASGSRMFDRYDTNGDGTVDESDPDPEPYRRRDREATQASN